ncbi:hypothetical protein AQJ43_29235 [Streptomyces avermitilis]|nr:hypothetical protein AQJ43_29235 [Streptomyces avermitilis]
MVLTDLLCVKLGDLLLCAGQADLQSLDLTEPSLLFGFGDSGGSRRSECWRAVLRSAAQIASPAAC